MMKCPFLPNFQEEAFWFTKQSTLIPFHKKTQEAKYRWHFSAQTWMGLVIVEDSQESVC